MGSTWSQSEIETKSSDSDSDIDYSVFSFSNNYPSSELPQAVRTGCIDDAHPMPRSNVLDQQTDATYKPVEINTALTMANLLVIEDELDKNEIISLIYLLEDNPKTALRQTEILLQSDKNERFLQNWFLSVKDNEEKWQKKILEALSIIQNYQILKKLGYNKTDLYNIFLPSRPETSYCISRLRKVLYLVADNLTCSESRTFVERMEKHLNAHSKYYEYMEQYFLFWEDMNINLDDIPRVLKVLEFDKYYDQLKEVLGNRGNMEQKRNEYPKPSVSKTNFTVRDNTFLQSLENIKLPSLSESSGDVEDESNKYRIDPENPGYVLLINQEFFHTETDPKYKHLLYDNNEEFKLNEREGTNFDRDRLERLFLRMNFKVLVKNNVSHINMLKYIEEATVAVEEPMSSFIVCIMSHGANGVVYGSNSCEVEVNRIQEIMCKKNKTLAGKPKVLILQSCQGQKCQELNESSDEEVEKNAIDGPTKAVPTADLLIFYATIPGYAAIRDKKSGSWFIQALCDEIESGNDKYHLMDICTRANYKVTGRFWKEKTKTNVMTPMGTFTLRKFFFLPPFMYVDR